MKLVRTWEWHRKEAIFRCIFAESVDYQLPVAYVTDAAKIEKQVAVIVALGWQDIQLHNMILDYVKTVMEMSKWNQMETIGEKGEDDGWELLT